MKKPLVILSLVVVLTWGAWFVFTEHLYVVPILAYHHVDEVIHSDSPTVLTDNFARQMEFISSRGYKVLTLDEVIEAIRAGKRLPRNSLAITFDDGYANNYIYAYPVLKKYNFPATIFIITGKDASDGFISREQMLQMQENNIFFGSHSKSHQYLPELKDEQLRDEIFNSKKELEEKINSEVKYFCYCFGGFSDKIIDMVKEAGYQAAFTTNRGKGRFNKNIYALKRVKVGNADTNPLRMWGKLSGFFNFFRSEKEPY
ncbi:MAG: polysaccharide deacetylase family protein [Candidatus Omnitrophica bacterium]|nr:polysaccharide deacetylase family protein [Candidatus Omnitrophota bacterium]